MQTINFIKVAKERKLLISLNTVNTCILCDYTAVEPSHHLIILSVIAWNVNSPMLDNFMFVVNLCIKYIPLKATLQTRMKTYV